MGEGVLLLLLPLLGDWWSFLGGSPGMKCNCGREEAVRLVGQVQRQVSAALDPGARQQARPGLWRPLAVRVLSEIHLRLVIHHNAPPKKARYKHKPRYHAI